MKLFIYKSLTLMFLIFILFHVTIGYVLRDYEAKIYNTFDKEKIVYLRQKIKDEIKDSLDNERILNKEDALLLKNFISKLRSEINLSE